MTATPASLVQRARANAPLVIAFSLFVSLAIPSSILNVAWEYIHTDLMQPYDALGVLLLFFTVGRLVSTFVSGRLIARFGLWHVVIGGMSLSLIGLIGTLFAPSWVTFLTAILITSYGWGTMDIGINLYIASHYRPGILNFLHASYGVGLTLGPQIVTLVVVTLGLNWRMSYLTPLVALSLLWLWTFFSRAQWVLPERAAAGVSDGAAPRVNHAGASIGSTLMLPIMGAWLLFALLYGGFEVGTGQLSNDLLTKSRGLDAAVASAWISFYWASFTIGRFLTGFIAGRVTEANMLIGCALLATAGGVLLSLPGLSLALPGLLLIGLALAGVFPTLISSIPRRFGPDHAPNAIGFTLGMASIGTAIMPGIGAFLAARTDFAVIGPYIVSMGLFLTVSYLLIVRLSRPQAG